MLEPIVEGSSKIDVNELSEAEQSLFEAARRIVNRKEMTNGDYAPSADELLILNTAFKRLHMRIFDLFLTYMKGFLGEKKACWFMIEFLQLTQKFIEADKEMIPNVWNKQDR